jgi:hypothetical protein
MTTLNVKTVPSNTAVTVQDANNVVLNVTTGNKVNVEVTPVATQIVQVSRGVVGPQGPIGPPGPNTIAGYPINMANVQPRDVVMFGTGEWVNTPQTEIADGGNF